MARRGLSSPERGRTVRAVEEPFALPGVQLSAPRAPLRGGGGPPSAPQRWGCKRRGGRRAPSTAGGGPCDPGGCLAPPPSASQACRGLCFSYNEIRPPPPDSGAGLGRNSRGLRMGSPSPRASRGDRAGREAPRGRRVWGPRGFRSLMRPGAAVRAPHSILPPVPPPAFQILKMFPPATEKCPNRL